MATTPINTILNWFKTGDFPTEAQFAAAWLSFFHKDDEIPMDSVGGLSETLETFSAVVQEQITNHINDSNAHGNQFVKLDGSNLSPEHLHAWLSILGILHAATIDGEDYTGSTYTKEQIDEISEGFKDIKNGLETKIEEIKNLLLSNDLDLDELQEIVDYIKENREQIEALQQISVGNTTDSKVELVGNYNQWGAVTLQNQFNDSVFDKIETIKQDLETIGVGRFETEIQENTTLSHNLNSYSLICEAYDTVTMFTVPIRIMRIDMNSVRIEFDDQPLNLINITIRKI